MTKKEIKAVVRRFKYFDKNYQYTKLALLLLELRKSTLEDDTLMMTSEQQKEVNRFEKEIYVVTRLFNVEAIEMQPSTLDPVKNPKRLTTKQQIKNIITSESNRDKETIQVDNFHFFPMTEEEYDVFLSALNDLKN